MLNWIKRLFKSNAKETKDTRTVPGSKVNSQSKSDSFDDSATNILNPLNPLHYALYQEHSGMTHGHSKQNSGDHCSPQQHEQNECSDSNYSSPSSSYESSASSSYYDSSSAYSSSSDSSSSTSFD